MVTMRLLASRISVLLLLAGACALAAVDFGPPKGTPFPGVVTSMGPKGAAVLIYPSSSACAFCKAQLLELEQHREAFHKLGLGVSALPYDNAAISKIFPGRKPHPGWFVLDARQVIVAKYFEEDASQVYTAAAILVHQFGWKPEPAQQVEGKQLTATVRASNSAVAPGERVVLTLDIALQPDMHVYAPGVEGYIPIDWKMEDSAAAEVHAPVFPRAEKLYLPAIDETVPAYRSHFRLTRDITIPAADKLHSAVDAAGHFAVDGTLRYQACDDRVCYIPQTLRLQWNFETQERLAAP
jgi:hypothetical protein